MININRAAFDFIAQVRDLNCKFYGILSELVFIIYCFDLLLYYLSICCYATRYMVAMRPFDIFLAKYYVFFARNSICYLRQQESIAPFLLAPQGISSALAPYRVADISSGASAAHIDVEPTCETHDGLDVSCSGEQIHRRNLAAIITQRFKRRTVARERCRVAGDVDNSFRGEGSDKAYQSLSPGTRHAQHRQVQPAGARRSAAAPHRYRHRRAGTPDESLPP